MTDPDFGCEYHYGECDCPDTNAKGENMNHYTTRNECIEREIVEPIEASGVVADARAEYDIDAIVDRCVVRVPHKGYRCAFPPRQFWAAVEANRLTNPQVDTNAKRIAALLGEHYYNDWAVDDTEWCSCGNVQPGQSWPDHVTDVLIAAGVTMPAIQCPKLLPGALRMECEGPEGHIGGVLVTSDSSDQDCLCGHHSHL